MVWPPGGSHPQGLERSRTQPAHQQAGSAFPAPTRACPQSRPSPSCSRTFCPRLGMALLRPWTTAAARLSPQQEMGGCRDSPGQCPPTHTHTEPAWETSLPIDVGSPHHASCPEQAGPSGPRGEAPLLRAQGTPPPEGLASSGPACPIQVYSTQEHALSTTLYPSKSATSPPLQSRDPGIQPSPSRGDILQHDESHTWQKSDVGGSRGEHRTGPDTP